MSTENLIRGRKCIMDVLKMNNWECVLVWKNKHGLPIEKIEGRWLANKARLLEWHDRKTGANDVKSVQNCAHAQISTQAKAAHARKRGPKMSAFLAVYVEVNCCVSEACRRSGLKRRTFYDYRKNYPRFDSACRSIENDEQELTNKFLAAS